jgi:hypothetical protein
MSIESLFIPAANGIDAITAYFDDIEHRKGRLTIVCHNQSWSAYWGGMGDRNVKEFILNLNKDYIVNYLIFGQRHLLSLNKRTSEEKYLLKIVSALQASLRANPELLADEVN